MMVTMPLPHIFVTRFRDARWRAGLLCGVTIAVSLLHASMALDRGWVPHDTGQLGQTAERVLHGQMQHRDFDEPYTGGLGCLNALAMELFGVRAESMRWMLLVYFALFLGAVYWIALRMAPPGVAALTTILCAALSVPIYPEGLPSWYNLFFAGFIIVALQMHLETGRRRWLFWAGCCAGSALLMKVTGIYLVAASLLYIAYHEQSQTHALSGQRTRVFSIGMTVLYVVFALLSCAFARGSRPLSGIVHFSLPASGFAAYLGWSEWRRGGGRLGVRARAIGALLVPFLLGIACLLIPFLVPYAFTHSLAWLYRGLFVLPAARVRAAALPPPALAWMLFSLPAAAVLAGGISRRWACPDARRARVLVGLSIGMLLGAGGTAVGYRCLFESLRNLIPLVAGITLIVLARTENSMRRQRLFIVAATMVMASLVQYPYAYGTYFFYAAPLMVLAALYAVANQAHASKLLLGGLLLLAILFSVLRLPQPDPRLLNGFYEPAFPTAPLNLNRCHYRVYAEDAKVYQEPVALIHAHSANDTYIYATPDCPEVYFLSGRRNPTRTMYELFDSPVPDRPGRLRACLARHDVRVVVINCRPAFSPPLAATAHATLTSLFPNQRVLHARRRPGAPGEPRFVVRWRGVPRDADVSCQPPASEPQAARDR